MNITSVRINGFRNLKDVFIQPETGVNVLCGENAQGKTNFMEAIWAASGQKSFRGAKEKDLIEFNSENASVEIVFSDAERSQTITYFISRNPRERKISLNGINLRSFQELVGKLLCVIFTPEDLELTKGSPDVRRNYIDLCISQIKPVYQKNIQKYDNILAQRNALLKNISLGISNKDELDIWDEQLARQGSYICMMRSVYTQVLNLYASKLYDDISRGKEKLELKYRSTVFDCPEGRTDYKTGMASEYYQKLCSQREEDVKLGYTQSGVHRDDISVKIDGISVKDFGSQGQNRSAALCMKLGQANELLKEKNEMPVILLDDVLSELDKYRRDFVLKQINDAQIFITCCEPVIKSNGILSVREGKILKG